MKFICSNCRAIVDAKPVYNEEEEKKAQKLREDFDKRASEYNKIDSLCEEIGIEWERHNSRWAKFWAMGSNKPYNDFLKRRYPELLELIEQGTVKGFGFGKLSPRAIRGSGIDGELWNYSYICTNCGCRNKYWRYASMNQYPTDSLSIGV